VSGKLSVEKNVENSFLRDENGWKIFRFFFFHWNFSFMDIFMIFLECSLWGEFYWMIWGGRKIFMENTVNFFKGMKV
jgi:hypothetical protein